MGRAVLDQPGQHAHAQRFAGFIDRPVGMTTSGLAAIDDHVGQGWLEPLREDRAVVLDPGAFIALTRVGWPVFVDPTALAQLDKVTGHPRAHLLAVDSGRQPALAALGAPIAGPLHRLEPRSLPRPCTAKRTATAMTYALRVP